MHARLHLLIHLYASKIMNGILKKNNLFKSFNYLFTNLYVFQLTIQEKETAKDH